MTSVRESIRRLLARDPQGEAQAAESTHPEFSYTIYWTKQVREWDVPRRRRALKALELIAAAADFVPNQFERRYQSPAIDESAHSGASLRALQKVLRAFDDESSSS